MIRACGVLASAPALERSPSGLLCSGQRASSSKSLAASAGLRSGDGCLGCLSSYEDIHKLIECLLFSVVIGWIGCQDTDSDSSKPPDCPSRVFYTSQSMFMA